ncbi:anti-sigma-28 factor, FlgM family [Thiohalospira halophila DSM 15071]|uniref:Negative regulator of flagellin synthesis n=1 Tax=Thiohalospira halophila DSM 15071 TaxID=1123397 RepID=A0A1I1WB35_9GAMM|nr:flagellar biosynthesis anti-sigma factor FlgM [Thiohalospira halophila]SFD92334.1 anti-sigma-28 factor, FlgM family [Thiohalospira halophila DSM 15071]
MAIEFNNRVLPGQTRINERDSTRPESGSGENAATKSSGSAGDKVSFTDVASRLQSLEAAMAQEPAVDPHRVESVRQSIEDGTFEVNAESIASRLMEMDQDLGNNGE